jgi:hypothetical protein
MMRRIWTLSFVVVAGGCSGFSTDIQPTMQLSARSDAELSRLAIAAQGGEGFEALDIAEGYAPATCPIGQLAGDTVTIVGGCVNAAATAFDGRISMENPITWPGHVWRDTDAAVYDFARFSATSRDREVLRDGRYEELPDSAGVVMDLAVAIDGVAVRSDLHIDTTQRYAIIEGGLELVGLGGVLVAGTRDDAHLDDDRYTLTGLDALEATVSVLHGTTTWTLGNRTCTIDVSTGGCRN